MIFETAALALMIASPQNAAGSDALDLVCRGNGDRFVSTQTKVRQVDGSVKTLTNNAREPFRDAVRIRVVNGVGQAFIPNAMLADDDTRGWHDIKKLSVTGEEIKGKVEFNWLFSPVMTLDRRSRILKISGSMANFMGNCTPYSAQAANRPMANARTVPSRTNPRAAARSAPDPRRAARAMAGRTDAQSAAINADLAFRLFNADHLPITQFVIIAANGTPSKNWLKGGERVAPEAFKPLRFFTAKTCNHNVRITYADGQIANQQINFCGKDILYASGTDIWAE